MNLNRQCSEAAVIAILVHEWCIASVEKINQRKGVWDRGVNDNVNNGPRSRSVAVGVQDFLEVWQLGKVVRCNGYQYPQASQDWPCWTRRKCKWK